MFLITSGAYIGSEFASELGLLPPSFLPLGNRCLYEYQFALGALFSNNVCLSIPASFVLSDYEQTFIDTHDVELIRVPEGLSLGESVLYCLNMTSAVDAPLQIIHGDTLFQGLPVGEDLISISSNTGFYHRAAVQPDTPSLLDEVMAVDGDVIASGYFSFSKPRELIQQLTLHQGSFIDAINGYNDRQPIDLVEVDDWYDFGHINAYFGSRAAFTTERVFNALEISKSTVRKTSQKVEKMRGEAQWFQCLPSEIQIYTPKLISTHSEAERAGYTLEYLYNLPLNDMFVFGRLADATWRSIFQSCHIFLNQCAQKQYNQARFEPESLNSLYLPKTLQRLEQYAEETGICVEKSVRFNGIDYPSPRELALLSNHWIPLASDKDIGIVHGDFCFSNILYDFRTRRIKVIDPRGINTSGEPTIFGDIRYDYAKLYHSVHGLYDLIVSGRLSAVVSGSDLVLQDSWFNYHQSINQAFDEVFFDGQPELRRTVHAISIQLFLSMLPLHSDRPDRQNTMLANAYRLYIELNGDSKCL